MNPHNMQLPLLASVSQVPELSDLLRLHNPILHALWHHNIIPCGVPDSASNIGIDDPADLLGLVTVSGTPYYLPPMRVHNDKSLAVWLKSAAAMYAESSQQLIADIYMFWLKHKVEKPLTPITIMWDQHVPLPTEATALWWLMQCESWPLPTSDIARLLRMAPAIGDNLTHWFPPQPFVFPQGVHLNNITNRPGSHIEAKYHSAIGYTESMTHNFLASLSRADRDAFARTSSDVTPIFRPNNADMMICHTRLGSTYEEISWLRSRYSEGKFTSNPDNAVDAGYAFDQIFASIHHLDYVQQLRNSIMQEAATIPGLPSHRHSLYGSSGMHLMCYQRANFSIKAKEATDWTHNSSRIVLNETSSAATIPRVSPKFWFGFTGDHRDWNNPDVNQHRMKWAQAYLSVRPMALRQLFKPDSVNWESIKLDAAKTRYGILHRANRIVDPVADTIKSAITGFNSEISTAFKALKKD